MDDDVSKTKIPRGSWLKTLKDVVVAVGPGATLVAFLFGVGEVCCKYGKLLCEEIAVLGTKNAAKLPGDAS